MERNLRMRESEDGRVAVLPWGQPSEPARFAVGDTVYSEPYDTTPGSVVAVDVAAGIVRIVWSDGNGGAINYPIEAAFLKKMEKLPWQ